MCISTYTLYTVYCIYIILYIIYINIILYIIYSIQCICGYTNKCKAKLKFLICSSLIYSTAYLVKQFFSPKLQTGYQQKNYEVLKTANFWLHSLKSLFSLITEKQALKSVA